MNTSTTITTATAAVISCALGAALLASTGVSHAATDTTGDGATRTSNVAYAGDPWEQRVRVQFWKEQHIHDSWNRCHVGENAPMLHQSPPECFPTLDS